MKRQYAGVETIAVSHSPDKDKMSRDLGARTSVARRPNHLERTEALEIVALDALFPFENGRGR